MAKPTETELNEVLNTDAGFRYTLLSRMQDDCAYALHANSNKHLWASGDPEKQIAYMKALHESFPDDAKPDWITEKDIEQYAVQMGVQPIASKEYGDTGIGGYATDGILTITEADIQWKDTGEVMKNVYFSMENSEGHPLDSSIFFSGVAREGMLNEELANEDFEILRVGDTYLLDSDGGIYGKDTDRKHPAGLNAKAEETREASDALKEARDDAGRNTQSFER